MSSRVITDTNAGDERTARSVGLHIAQAGEFVVGVFCFGWCVVHGGWCNSIDGCDIDGGGVDGCWWCERRCLRRR